MRRAFLSTALAAVFFATGLPLVAVATTFTFNSGSVLVTGTTPSVTGDLFSDTVPLTGTSVEFDDSVPSLTSIQLVGGTTSSTPLSAPFGGFDAFTLDAFAVSFLYDPLAVPAHIMSVTQTGPSTYSFAVGPISVSGSATAHDTTNTISDQVIPFGFTNPFATGTIDLTTNTLVLDGITLGQIDVGGEILTVKGDFTFVGLPEPGLSALLACAAIAMVQLRGRRLS